MIGRRTGCRRRDRERGSAMLVMMIVVVALLAGAAVVTAMQVKATRSAQLTQTGLASLYCAEAGLVSARAAVASNYPLWNAALGSATEPSWLAGIDHDLDDDGVADFVVTLRDNDDEVAPLINDLTRDNDLAVFVVSTCVKYPDVPIVISELVRYNGGGGCYESQLGGCGGNANRN